MNAVLANAPPEAHAIMERVLVVGDLAKLTPAERITYYNATCQSLGLNPLTRPFEYTQLSGKLVLYARKDAADQLRRIHGISVKLTDRKVEDGICTVIAHAHDNTGRDDEDIGVVSVGQLKGEFLANALKKAVTQAKRRVTLSICGLGFPDESDIENERRMRRREPVDHTKPRIHQTATVAQTGIAAVDAVDEVADDLAAYEERIATPTEATILPVDPPEPVPTRFPLVRLTGEVVDARDFEDWYFKMDQAVRRYEGANLTKLMELNAATLQSLAQAWPDEIDHLQAAAEDKLKNAGI